MAQQDQTRPENFHEFFTALRELAGMPGETEMWKGFRATGLIVSPATVKNWVKGRAIPNTYRFKGAIQEIFGLPDIEFNRLESGSILFLTELALRDFEDCARVTGINDDQAIRLSRLIIETS